MIEILKELTRNLVLLLLLATFLEMLLPKSQLSRYIRLVVGLFVLLTVLQPLTGFLERQGTIRLPVREPPPGQLEALISRGVELGEYQKEVALQAVKERLEQQLEAMLYLAHGSDGIEVDLTLEHHEETGPQIKQAVVLLTGPAAREPAAGTLIARVEPVLISEPAGQLPARQPQAHLDEERETLREKVAGGVSAYLGIDRSLVFVDFVEQ